MFSVKRIAIFFFFKQNLASTEAVREALCTCQAKLLTASQELLSPSL